MRYRAPRAPAAWRRSLLVELRDSGIVAWLLLNLEQVAQTLSGQFGAFTPYDDDGEFCSLELSCKQFRRILRDPRGQPQPRQARVDRACVKRSFARQITNQQHTAFARPTLRLTRR